MEHLYEADEASWRWSCASANHTADEKHAYMSQLPPPRVRVRVRGTPSEGDGVTIATYWGSLGDSYIVHCTEDGKDYLVCTCATLTADLFLIQRVKNMMEYSLANFASEAYPFVWTPATAWLTCSSYNERSRTRLPSILTDVTYSELSDSESDAQPKSMHANRDEHRYTIVRHIISLSDDIRLLDVHLGHLGPGHIKGCEYPHSTHHMCLCGAEMCLYAARCVSALHSKGCVHREIHTGALLVRDSGDILLGSMWSTAPPGAPWFARNEGVQWEMWRAPEGRDEMGIDCHADVFSLGLVMLDIMWSVRMHTLGTLEGMRERRRELIRSAAYSYELPTHTHAFVPAPLRSLLATMLSFDSVERPDAFEVVGALEEYSGIVD